MYLFNINFVIGVSPSFGSRGMPASEPVRLGRKRALPPCPNPLFLKWLTELRDEAREKGLKTQYTYHKVRRTTGSTEPEAAPFTLKTQAKLQ